MLQNVNLLSVAEFDIVSGAWVTHLTFNFCYVLKLDEKEAILEILSLNLKSHIQSSNISPVIQIWAGNDSETE